MCTQQLRYYVFNDYNFQALSHAALPQHSTDDKFNWVPSDSNPDENSSETMADQLLSSSLDGLLRGDSHQFMQISDRGYAFEHSLAFFPLYPLAVRTFAAAASFAANSDALPLVSRASLLKLSACYLNAVAFVLAADLLYSLSRRVLRDETLSYRAALLFCLNPASVSFSAPSSDAFFACATFASLLALEKRGLDLITASLLATASGIRASGVALAGFVVYHSMKTVATETILFIRSKKRKSTNTTNNNNNNSSSSNSNPAETLMSVCSAAILPGCVSVIASTAPFLAFQWYSYRAFCESDAEDFDLSQRDLDAAKKNGFVTPGAEERGAWCQDDPPVSYVHVQTSYWGVALLKYWEGQYLPQMVSAAPAAGT